MMTCHSPRQPDHAVDPLFVERWSPRAFDGSSVSDEVLGSLFEAARWAPSAFNAQPWRFRYARRDTAHWDAFVGCLMPFNQGWARNASVLIYVLSDRFGPAKEGTAPSLSYSHSFDAGAAWAQLALQASRTGLYAHGMTGVDFDAARVLLEAPEPFRFEAAIAVGRLADKSILPEALQAREAPSVRKPVRDFVLEGVGGF